MNGREFAIGDRVRIVDYRGGTGVWVVEADDTNATPVRDPEPAYRLESESATRSTHVRYAYASSLRLVTARQAIAA